MRRSISELKELKKNALIDIDNAIEKANLDYEEGNNLKPGAAQFLRDHEEFFSSTVFEFTIFGMKYLVYDQALIIFRKRINRLSYKHF